MFAISLEIVGMITFDEVIIASYIIYLIMKRDHFKRKRASDNDKRGS